MGLDIEVLCFAVLTILFSQHITGIKQSKLKRQTTIILSPSANSFGQKRVKQWWKCGQEEALYILQKGGTAGSVSGAKDAGLWFYLLVRHGPVRQRSLLLTARFGYFVAKAK